MIQARTPGNPSACYVDSSAYIEHLTTGVHAKEVAAQLTGFVWKSSTVLALETYRGLSRLVRERHISISQFHQCVDRLDEDLLEFELKDATLEICTGHVLPPLSLPKSLDLLHLRTAMWFHKQAPLSRFVTLDNSLRKAAKELGLPV